MSSETAVRVTALSKSYPIYDKPGHRLRQFIMPRIRKAMGLPPRNYFRSFEALRNISFEVNRGETVGIIGRNGSGKSTLLQLICSTLTPTAGDVEVFGRVAALLELGSGFNPEFSGRENVYMNSALLGLSRKETTRRFDQIVDFADIGDFIDQPVKTYSSGMVVRLAFAVTINVDPDILVIDEALSVGDAAFQFKCLKRIESLQEKGVTLLFVSHDMALVQSFCQRAIYLERGEIKTLGNPEAVAAQYFFDNRELHRQALGLESAIRQQKTLGPTSQAAAFGTGEGSILKACFPQSGFPTVQMPLGGEIEMEVEIDAPHDQSRLALAVVIQNHRLVEITGRRFLLEKSSSKRRSFRIVQKNIFTCGDYFITLRLLRHVGYTDYMPIQSQIAALHFQVNDDMRKLDFLGLSRSESRLEETTADHFIVIALLAVRNESTYMDRCISHLVSQGIDVYVIDNESTDNTVEIAQKWVGQGVIGIETLPYEGFYDWRGILERKAELAASLEADWFIHHDADEIRQSPRDDETLKEAILRLDAQGYNAIDFHEFVFLPRDDDDEPVAPGDYVERLNLGYYFAPTPDHRVNAWKKTDQPPDLVTHAGHQVLFHGRSMAPEKLILRHYPCVSAAHLRKKYGLERVYSEYEVNDLKWHGERAHYRPEAGWWPSADQLIDPHSDGWDTSRPWREHPFLGGEPPQI